jgi:hypothetical protein
MFHYVMGRTYGEEGDQSTALYHLQKAFDRKAKMPPGEKLPDPLTDSSFATFADDPAFKSAIAGMKR